MKHSDSKRITVSSPTMAVTHFRELPALALVEAIAGRYCHWLSCERRPEAIVRRNAGPQHNWYNSTVLSHRPHFHIELAFAAGRPLLEANAVPESRVFRTLFDRLERRESITQSTTFSKGDSPLARLAHAETSSAARPVERIVQSSRKVTVSALQQPDAETHRQDGQSFLPKIDWPSPRKDAAALPDAEVGRLAEQVIRTIDRRMIAQRERMGRR